MIELDDYDLKLIKEIEKTTSRKYGTFEYKGKEYIPKDVLVGILENTYDDYLYLEEQLLEVNEKMDELWKEKQGSWLDPYIRMKMRCEELEENIEQMKSQLSKDDYFELADKGVEL